MTPASNSGRHRILSMSSIRSLKAPATALQARQDVKAEKA
jgi:hypothetical protein